MPEPTAERLSAILSGLGTRVNGAQREALLTLPFDAGSEKRFRRMAEESLAEQRRIEAADQMPFETYRQRYLAGELPLDDDR